MASNDTVCWNFFFFLNTFVRKVTWDTTEITEAEGKEKEKEKKK